MEIIIYNIVVAALSLVVIIQHRKLIKANKDFFALNDLYIENRRLIDACRELE